MWIRVPLVPGVNDDDRNLSETVDFVRSLRGSPPVHLLPYHRIGSDKYDRLGIPYLAESITPPSRERLAAVAGELTAAGLDVKIGG